MNAILKNRLAQYGAFAAIGTLPSGKIAAQEVYTDVDPDTLLYSVGEYWVSEPGWLYFDLNADGALDVGLDFDTHSACYACPVWTYFHIDLADNVTVPIAFAPACYLSSTFGAGYSSTACIFPEIEVLKPLYEGDTLSEALNWDVIDDVFDTQSCGWYGEACKQGDLDPHDAKNFLTFRIIDTDTSYCWMRLRFADDSMFVAEYACNSTPEYVIHDKIADVVNNLSVIADTCTGNTDEIHVMFDPALYENSVSEYRIMVAPTVDFSADEALLVAPGNYVSVIPNGLPVDVRLPADFHNYTGTPLLPEQDIKVSVFSIFKAPVSNICAQVWSAQMQFGASGKAEAPITLDLHNETSTYTSADLSLTVISTVDTAKTEAYRLMFLPSADMPFFSVDMARSVESANYILLPPNPLAAVHLPVGMTIWNGEPMLPEVYYRAVILALPNTPDYCVSKLGGFSGAAKYFQAPVAVSEERPAIFVRYDQDVIHIDNHEQLTLNIQVYDISGRVLCAAQSMERNIQIPFDYPAGMYFVHTRNAYGTQVMKIMHD